MAIVCQTCGAPIPDAVVLHDDHQMEAVEHDYPSPDGPGTITDYYCDPDCASIAFGSAGGAQD